MFASVPRMYVAKSASSRASSALRKTFAFAAMCCSPGVNGILAYSVLVVGESADDSVVDPLGNGPIHHVRGGAVMKVRAPAVDTLIG